MTAQIISVPGYTGPDRRNGPRGGSASIDVSIDPLTDSQLGRLVDAVTESDRMRAMDSRFDAVERALDVAVHQLQQLTDKLDANTQTTEEVKSIISAGKVLGKLLPWVAALIASGMSIWVSWRKH
jgi:hypothetical protein